MDTQLNDTIVAISTPVGYSGLGIVRLSGKDAIKIAEKIFQPKNKSKIVSQLKTFTTHLGYIVDEEKIVDEVLMTIMRQPHSYTCEDVIEFSCHGGPVVLQQVVELCVKHGARIAEPGEFTKRAFLNGRIDLSYAESVCDIIYSKTKLQNQLYINSLLGKTKHSIEQLVNQIKDVIAELEVSIDYPDEDDVKTINFDYVKEKIFNVIKNIDSAIEYSEKISPILYGINVAIVGKVNVGKSSLLNILLDYDRAIVSDIPGTTRDTLSETIIIKDVPIRIVDTAGIRTHSQDVIENIGIERTKNAVKEANVIILMFDASTNITTDDYTVVDTISAVENVENQNHYKTIIPVLNKIDKEIKIFDTNDLENLILNLQKSGFNLYPQLNQKNFNKQVLKISCVTKEGVEKLENAIVDSQNVVETQYFSTQDAQPELIVTNLRQKEVLKKAKTELEYINKFNFIKQTELVCEHLRYAVKELQKIVGSKDLTEDVLDIIFSRFCVGK
jgi:tRNA modification GTPase